MTDPRDRRAARTGSTPDRTARTIRSARIALVVGGLLLSAAAALIVWDAADGDHSQPVITGRTG